MNRYFDRVATVNNSPEGALNDGLPLDREEVGPLEIGGEQVDIGLVRVKDKDYGQIWLIASDTVARVPALYKSIENTWIERVMPEALLKYKPFGTPSLNCSPGPGPLAFPCCCFRFFHLLPSFSPGRLSAIPEAAGFSIPGMAACVGRAFWC